MVKVMKLEELKKHVPNENWPEEVKVTSFNQQYAPGYDSLIKGVLDEESSDDEDAENRSVMTDAFGLTCDSITLSEYENRIEKMQISPPDEGVIVDCPWIEQTTQAGGEVANDHSAYLDQIDFAYVESGLDPELIIKWHTVWSRRNKIKVQKLATDARRCLAQTTRVKYMDMHQKLDVSLNPLKKCELNILEQKVENVRRQYTELTEQMMVDIETKKNDIMNRKVGNPLIKAVLAGAKSHLSDEIANQKNLNLKVKRLNQTMNKYCETADENMLEIREQYIDANVLATYWSETQMDVVSESQSALEHIAEVNSDRITKQTYVDDDVGRILAPLLGVEPDWIGNYLKSDLLSKLQVETGPTKILKETTQQELPELDWNFVQTAIRMCSIELDQLKAHLESCSNKWGANTRVAREKAEFIDQLASRIE